MVAAWNDHGGCSDREAVTVNEIRNKIDTQPGQQSVPAEFLSFIDMFSFFVFCRASACFYPIRYD